MKNILTISTALLLLVSGPAKAEIVHIISGEEAREETLTYKVKCSRAAYELQIDKKSKTIVYSGTLLKNEPSFKVDISGSEIAKFFLDRTYFGNISMWCGAGLSIDYRGFQVRQNMPSRGFRYKGAIMDDGTIVRDTKVNDLPVEGLE